MKYSIPVPRIEKLQKIIAKYQRKGANITLELGGFVTLDGVVSICDKQTHTYHDAQVKVKCQEVFVDGKYIIEDWQFVGTIQFTQNGNIIRLADSSFEGMVPEKYLHTPQVCEHCNTIRNRKDTYLIYNIKTNEFKQVGSKCLLDYTKGLDADECASIMSCLNQMVELGNLECNDDEFFGFKASSGFGCGSDVKNHALALVKAKGYKGSCFSCPSYIDLSNFYFKQQRQQDWWKKEYGSIQLATKEEVEAVDEFARQHINDGMGYMRNASLAWLSDCIEYRDFGLICSFANTYLKEVEKAELRKQEAMALDNSWVGNIGDRITIKVAKARPLYYKDNSHKSYYACETTVYKIIDDKGHTFKWSTSHDVEEGDTIVATVKEHATWKDLKQTVITRGTIQHEEE